MSKVKFINNQPVFFNTLRERIDSYFKQNQIKSTGDFRLYSKTIILLTTMVGIYTWLVFFTPPTFLALILCGVLGLNFATIGFNVMHDGAHGSYSKKGWVNECMAYTLNMMGGSSYMWKLKHNVNHHSFTNIEGVDDDIDIKPFIRVHAEQKGYWFHRFQHIYSLLLYGLTYLFWIYFRDFTKYFSGKIAAETKLKKMNLKEHFIFWTSKVIYTFIFLVIPVMQLGLVNTLIGYGVMVFVTGVILAVVFQLAHVVESTEFVAPTTDDEKKIETEWAVHQIKTTANFATDNKVVNWMLGGLNFQVEHHLFPRISHVHYPKINKIVKQTCREFNINYLEFPTMSSAVKSHLLHLKRVGAAA